MKNASEKVFQRFRKYHFELKHLLVVLIVLIFFQILVSLVHKTSLKNLLVKTQDWYQQDSAERLANLLATSLEMLLETAGTSADLSPETAQKVVQGINNILSQPLLQQNVEDICILIDEGEHVRVIDNGRVLFRYFFEDLSHLPPPDEPHSEAVKFYQKLKQKIRAQEQIFSIRQGRATFHVFVPFVPKGEFVGALYVRNTPNFSFITREVIASYDETAMIFAALILLGLLAMFYISSYTVKERDIAQKQLYEERENHLREQIHHQKEAQFTRRIYHTHHKAEKVMGFIKEDLTTLSAENIDQVKYRVTKYANFISRVIYDMKWYDLPLQTIRNPIFRTDINEVIRFLVENIFMRISEKKHFFRFELDLDDRLPPVAINEFVIWEIIEPLIQNSLDHAGEKDITVTIRTRYDSQSGTSTVTIADNGRGIKAELLEKDENGVKKIFLENVSTKKGLHNSGYGCYLAYEIATQRCGWKLDAENLQPRGCRFIITIPHGKQENNE